MFYMLKMYHPPMFFLQTIQVYLERCQSNRDFTTHNVSGNQLYNIIYIKET